jgi:hypothetical protein
MPMEYYVIFDITGPHADSGEGFQASTKRFIFGNDTEALLWFHNIVKADIIKWNLHGDLSLYANNRRITSTII